MTEEHKVEAKTKPVEYGTFLDYRQELVQLAEEYSRSYDKYVLTLSSGGLGLSLLILKDVANTAAVSENWLIASWILFGVSIISTLFNFPLARRACNSYLKQWDREWVQGEITESVKLHSYAAGLSNVLDVISGVAFMGGAIALLVFAFKNL